MSGVILRHIYWAFRGAACPVIVALTLAGCAPSHAGRTLGRGVLQVEGGLGGPFVTNLGGAIPVPNLPLGVRYGVRDRLDVWGHVNALPLVMGGFMSVDTGVTWALVRHEGRSGPNLATSAGLALLTDFRNGARLSPIFDLAGGYTYRFFTTYVGIEVFVDFWGSNVVANPYLGFEFDVRRASLSLAAVWFNPGLDSFASTAQYIAPGDHGGIGIILGVKYRWDLERRRGGDDG